MRRRKECRNELEHVSLDVADILVQVVQVIKDEGEVVLKPSSQERILVVKVEDFSIYDNPKCSGLF